ncbi:hypothetical protein LIER_41302 [Lithospermum erythrorhizon]|uniref:Uncharacterized protein n=1 Tax=Lithospermum erythrorhizon TaxID=34254 RepID=A0AAV3R8N8_LITER
MSFLVPLLCFFSVPLDPPSCSQFFGLQGVVLQSYRGLQSSYEEVSGSSSRSGQLEDELKALRKEKAWEEGVLQRRLRILANLHTTLQVKYPASVRRIEAIRADLDGVQAERDSILKEREGLRAGRDEILQTHNRLLDQLTKSQR